MATSSENSPEERIILATIACIERQGPQNVTIRSIAKEAGVNSAAINYYFRSKEKLVAHVMATTLDHLFEDLEAIVADDSLNPTERMSEILDYLIDGATRYPGITRAHIYETMTGATAESPFADRMNAVLSKLRTRLLARGDGENPKLRERQFDLYLIELVSAAMLPAIMPTFFRGFSG
ncbi:MAG TPA: TetR/AcrR family transcriptional regulator, partial [Spirochaetia bacterium]|nr:TetR/AcrR family transcriptional regulator [Spirochaetia bacterium]